MSKKTANDTTLQSTKQMLDELDALMEQMLSLPVSDPDEAPAFPKNVVRQPTLTATLTMLESPAPLPKTIAQEPTVHPRLNAPHMAAPSHDYQEMEEERAPELTPLTSDAVPVSLLPRMEPLLAAVPEMDAAATTLWCYQPLVWINLAFDEGTMKLGALGALLRTQASRMLLGLSGMALLVVSAGWFLKDWLGWNW